MAENARLPSSPTPTSVALAHGDEHADWLAAARAGDIFVMKKLIASSCDRACSMPSPGPWCLLGWP